MNIAIGLKWFGYIWIALVHRECPVLQHPRFWKLGTDAVVLSRRHLHRLKSWLLPLTWSRGHHGQQQRRNFRTRPQLWGRKPTTTCRQQRNALMSCSCIVSWLVCNFVPRHCLVCMFINVYFLPLSGNHPTTLSAKTGEVSLQSGRVRPAFDHGRGWIRCSNESNRCTTATSATVSFKWHSRLPDFWKLQVDWSVRCSDRKASTKLVGYLMLAVEWYMVACNCSLSCESPINFGQLFSVVTVAAKIFNEFYLLTPFAQKLFLFFHHGCIPDLLLQFRFHFDCQFQASGAISWEAEAWVSWKQMEWRVWSCRCC